MRVLLKGVDMRYTYPVLVIEDELGGYCTYLNDFDQVLSLDLLKKADEADKKAAERKQ